MKPIRSAAYLFAAVVLSGGSALAQVGAIPGMTPGAAASEVRFNRQLGPLGKQPVSLQTDRADPWDAILNLLRNAGVNYVIGGEAMGGRKITARFQDVPLEEALDALADAAGLNYTTRRGIIILSASEPRALPVYSPFGGSTGRYPNLPGVPSATVLTAPPAEVRAREFAPPAAATPKPPPLEETPPPPAAVTPSTVSGTTKDKNQIALIRFNNRSVEGMEQIITSLLPQYVTLSSIVPDTRTNSLLISAPPAVIQKIEALTRLLDEGAPPLPATPAPSAQPAILVKLHYFEKAGDLPQTWSSGAYTKTAAQDPDTRILVVKNVKSLEDLVKQVQTSGGVLTHSPAITTLSGIPAELSLTSGVPVQSNLPGKAGSSSAGFSTPNAHFGFYRVVPQVNTDDTITLSISLDPNPSLTAPAAGVTTAGSRAEAGGRESSDSNPLTRRIRQDEALALLRFHRAEGKEGKADLLLIQARVQPAQSNASYGAKPSQSR